MTALRQQGINALKTGDKSQGRQLLQMAVDENPQDAQAWLWLSGAVENDQERFECLKTVIKLDPDNAVAAKGIAKLVASGNLEIQVKSAETPLPPPVQVQSEPVSPPRQTQSPANPAPKVVFESRPSFVPFVIGSGLILLIIGFVGGIFSALIGDNQIFLILFWGLLCIMSIWAFGKIFFALLNAIVTRYTLTTRHLIVQSGVFSRSKKTIPISKIQDVSSHQLFLFRPFGIGDVIVESAGEWGQTKLRALPHCDKRSKQILKLVHKHT